MIPQEIVEAMREQEGEVIRTDKAAALVELDYLGVPADSQIAEFFRTFEVSAVSGPSSKEELMDVASPSPQIRRATKFMCEVYEVPDRFLCLTSAEGEGGYLYEKTTGAVFDFEVSDLDALIEGRLVPKWKDFFSFIRWYLTGE